MSTRQTASTQKKGPCGEKEDFLTRRGGALVAEGRLRFAQFHASLSAMGLVDGGRR